MHPAQERRALELDLREALTSEQFQPLLPTAGRVAKRRVTTCEALMRWKHPNRGMVPLAVFIPIPEETGLIIALGEWALQAPRRRIGRKASKLPSIFRRCNSAIAVLPCMSSLPWRSPSCRRNVWGWKSPSAYCSRTTTEHWRHGRQHFARRLRERATPRSTICVNSLPEDQDRPVVHPRLGRRARRPGDYRCGRRSWREPRQDRGR